ncbi:MAG: hypothetical protein GX483_00615 [Actinomycetaceae bacterium]|nr:hypothetical protein [Actinomycetaceae bacterium]
MPRTVEEILAHADELAEKFENYTPRPEDEVDAQALRAILDAVGKKSAAEKQLLEAIIAARKTGMTWNTIGKLVGTSGEAARQRFGKYAT